MDPISVPLDGAPGSHSQKAGLQPSVVKVPEEYVYFVGVQLTEFVGFEPPHRTFRRLRQVPMISIFGKIF